MAKKVKTAAILQEFARLGYEFRMNEMDNSIELNGERLTDPIRARIHNELNDAGYNSAKRIDNAYTDLAERHSYHPIKEYLDDLEWDGQSDYVGELMQHLTVDDEYIEGRCNWGRVFLQRWLIGAVAKVYELTQNFCLVLDGPQDLGKSSFGRWLCPLPEYYSEAPFKAADNDSRLRKMRTWLWEIGELQTTTRKSDREALKHEISEVVVVARRPYAKYDIRKPNLTSFLGTVNETGTGFLNDPTGSRRFATIRLVDIDWRAYTREMDVADVWSQAKALYDAGEGWTLSQTEKHKQHEFNQAYEAISPLEELFDDVFYIEPDPDPGDWMPAMEIVQELEDFHGLKGNQMMNLRNLAELMTKRGVESGRPRLQVQLGGSQKIKRLRSYKGVHKR